MVEAFSVHAEPVEAFRSAFQQPAKFIPNALFKFSLLIPTPNNLTGI